MTSSAVPAQDAATKPPSAYTRAMMAWVGMVADRPWLLLSLVILLMGLSIGAVVTRLGVTTDTTDMLAPELQFRQDDRALREAFPDLGGNLIVVVQADTPELADATAAALTDSLTADSANFDLVVNFAGLDYFRKNGLLMLPMVELEIIADTVIPAQPFLGSLWQDPSLDGLSDLLDLVIDPPGGGDANAEADLSGLAPMLNAMAEATAAGPEALRPVSWQGVLQGQEVTAADKRRFLLVKPRLDYSSLAPAAKPMRSIREKAATLEPVIAGQAQVRLTGPAALSQEELNSVKTGMDMAGILSFILVSVLLAIGLRSGRVIFATLSALVAGLVITAGFAAVAVGTLNLISVSFAVLFIGLSVDFGIHFGLRYREERLKTETNRDALVRAAEGTGAPLGLAALAAAIAFLAFLPTDYIGLAQLGLISGVGMAIALTLNLTVPPAILSLLPGKIPERPEACPMSQDWPEGWPDEPDGPNSPTTSSAACQALSRGLTVRPKMTLLCAGVAGVIALALLPFTRFDFDPLNLKDPGTESVATLMEILGDPGIDPYAIEILADTPDQAASLAEELTALPLVRSVLSLSTLVPQEQDDKLLIVEEMAFALGPGLAGEPGALAPEDPVAALESLQAVLAKAAAAEDRLGPEAAAASQAFLDSMSAFPKDPEAIIALNRALTSGLLLALEQLRTSLEADWVEVEDLPAALANRYVNDQGQVRLEVLPTEDLRDQAALRDFVAQVRTVSDRAIGAPVVIVEAGGAVLSAFAEAALLAFIAITILIYAATRSLRAVLLIFAPILLAGLLTAATTVLLGIAFNFANVIVLPLLVGLGVAGGIHVVGREREEADVTKAMDSCTPRAILFSALTTIGSFGSIALSSHPGTASMGVLLTFAIALGLLCTLGILPALMRLWPQRDNAGATT